jgi:hypothetical protein
LFLFVDRLTRGTAGSDLGSRFEYWVLDGHQESIRAQEIVFLSGAFGVVRFL